MFFHWQWKCKLVQPHLKSSCRFLRILGVYLKTQLYYSLLGIYPKDAPPFKDICLTMFIATSLMIPRDRNQHKYPSSEEWIQKKWFTYTVKYSSDVENKGIMKFAGKWMELEKIILCEVTQTQKEMFGT